ncbi:MAG: hypothetical protein VX265_00040 [Myxococcota bacterium]|nr:hypothetical protein [Myxococcota bacterium]
MDWKDVRDYKEMMACTVRMDAYRAAIGPQCVGRTVCEIGVGLGPLSLMALKAGARRVYGIELDREALDCAAAILADNGFGPDRFVPVHGISTRVSLPERVDVLLSETLDSMGVGENTALYMRDARERHMKPDAVFLPGSVTCVTALARPRVWEKQRRFWTDTLQSGWDLDYRGMLPTILPMNRVIEVHQADLRSKWAVWQRVHFDRPETFQKQSMALLRVEQPGEVTGLARAFVADMGAGVELSTLSSQPLTCWKQFFAPFARPLQLAAGDAVFVEFTANEPEFPGLAVESRITHVPAAALPRFMSDLQKRLAQEAAN